MPTQLARCVNSLTSMDDEAQLRLLEEVVRSISPSALCPTEQAALFSLFGRFPDADAFGVFFSVMHKLEASPVFEAELVRSVQRSPVTLNLSMVAAIVRGGTTYYRETNLLELLNSVAKSCQ